MPRAVDPKARLLNLMKSFRSSRAIPFKRLQQVLENGLWFRKNDWYAMESSLRQNDTAFNSSLGVRLRKYRAYLGRVDRPPTPEGAQTHLGRKSQCREETAGTTSRIHRILLEPSVDDDEPCQVQTAFVLSGFQRISCCLRGEE